MNNDLISREALKKALEEYKYCGFYDKLIELIDNAPTVEVEPEKIAIANVSFDENKLKEIVQTEVIEKIKSGELVIKDERPQGELAEKLNERIVESVCRYCRMNKHCELCEISRVFQIITLTAEEQKGGAE